MTLTDIPKRGRRSLNPQAVDHGENSGDKDDNNKYLQQVVIQIIF
jgi:hypothetical protein